MTNFGMRHFHDSSETISSPLRNSYETKVSKPHTIKVQKAIFVTKAGLIYHWNSTYGLENDL